VKEIKKPLVIWVRYIDRVPRYVVAGPVAGRTNYEKFVEKSAYDELTEENVKLEKIYKAAVTGRKEFRQMYRDLKADAELINSSANALRLDNVKLKIKAEKLAKIAGMSLDDL